MKDSQMVTFKTSKENVAFLDEIAKGTSRSRSAVLEQSIDVMKDIYDWQIAHVEKGIKQIENGEVASQKEVDAFFKKFD